ncbi:MAG: hypothetical protein QXT73_01150 [Candidatus Methanomethylicaceae archaeon]
MISLPEESKSLVAQVPSSVERAEEPKTITLPEVFEDFFPPIQLDDKDKENLVSWFEKDLLKAKRFVETFKERWAINRALFLLDEFRTLYPSLYEDARFPSGLVCEKVLEGMNQLKASILRSRPFFVPDLKLSGSSSDVDFFYRSQWCLHSVMTKILRIQEVLCNRVFFEFLLDGSSILEIDTLYAVVPQRTLKVFTTPEELEAYSDKVLSKADLDRAFESLSVNGIAKVLVEDDVVEENGLRVFHVNKLDHLIPPGVYSDDDIRFRARRMYLTEGNLRLLAQSGWYDEEAVQIVLQHQSRRKGLYLQAEDGDEAAREMLNTDYDVELSAPLDSEGDSLSATHSSYPYKDVFYVYRILCKYGYTTRSDPHGLLPKYCLFDYSPVGKQILRAVTYPHFRELPNYFHFRLSHSPKSYYGLGYGKRLEKLDLLLSSAVTLYMDNASLACFTPFVCRHPDAGGMIPFTSGFGPAKIGYVNDVTADFRQVEIRPPPEGLVRLAALLTETKAEKLTGITSLIQGRTEQADPRSPAQKTELLLRQASVGLDMMLEDWSRSGWNALARFVWMAMYEIAACAKVEGRSTALDGLIIVDEDSIGEKGLAENVVTFSEVARDLHWESTASSIHLNPELRVQRFVRNFQFFFPLLKELSAVNPEAYKKYFLRWMRRAAQELGMDGDMYLVPTEEELMNVNPQALNDAFSALIRNYRSGHGPQEIDLSELFRPQSRGGVE